ncbi:MAG TPA: sugar phosphate isomerase/epimerase [Clostridiales bacterium]|nr:sugar phosphate isomerase/epimerase [Clostridiales bacterium]
MKISFTTLSCPNWSWEKILDEAQRLGYDGIEVRGIQGEMYLPNAVPFLPENLERTKVDLKRRGLEICCLDTSCTLHDKSRIEMNIKEGKETIDLAQKLGVPYIRVFGNDIPDKSRRDEIVDFVAKGLNELGEYAKERSVCVLIETHGDFSASEELLAVLQKTSSPAIGVLWDVHHPYKFFGESLAFTYERLGKYIKHTHFKDSRGMGHKAKLCLVGDGDLPVAESIEILKKNNYNGYLSLEWEKKWHPEIEEPEIALPAFISYIKQFL